MIQEAFLHFVWQHQYFNKSDLKTQFGELVSIKKVGFHNQLAGPDFKEAELIIGTIHWAGSVEVHIKSSDWYAHKHQSDPNYHNVILHLVYEHDMEVLDSKGDVIPTVSLRGLIKPKLLERYKAMIEEEATIPCGSQLGNTKVITRLSMLEKTLVKRLEKKSLSVKDLLKENNFSWEETTYQWLAKGFGFKTNSELMLTLAQSVPSKVLRKHNQLMHYEALLFGASGLLNVDLTDEYPRTLQKEYAYLKVKYNIQENLSYNQWNFSGVRPANFPTIRIAQFAALMHQFQNLFSLLTGFSDAKELIKSLSVEQSAYWKTHLVIDKQSKMTVGPMTDMAKYNLLINTTAPLLVAFARHHNKSEFLEKAMNLLMALPKEKNKITKSWAALGWNVSSAFDSQGLIELHNECCLMKRCISCSIGAELIKG